MKNRLLTIMTMGLAIAAAYAQEEPKLTAKPSYTKVTNREGFANNEVSILETRLQVKF